MENAIKIIKANASDFERFYNFYHKHLKDGNFLYSPNSISYTLEFDHPKELLKDEFLKGKRSIYLAFIRNKVVGYLMTTKTRCGVAFGHWLGVDPKHQRKGIASSFLSAWEKDALKEGAHVLEIWTTVNNLDFYKNRGFTHGGNFPESWFGIDHFLFYKPLQKADEKIFLKDYLKIEKKKNTTNRSS